MKPTNLILGLAPWFAFSFAAQWLGPDHITAGAALACLGSLALAIRNATKTGPNLLDIAGVATFGALTTIAALGDHTLRHDIADYGRGGAAAVLALVMAISALTIPFTESLARHEVDRRYWGSPVFRAVNRKISLVWAGLIALMAAGHLTAGALAANGEDRPLVRIALNWGLPLLILMRGMKTTEQITTQGLGVARPADRVTARHAGATR